MDWVTKGCDASIIENCFSQMKQQLSNYIRNLNDEELVQHNLIISPTQRKYGLKVDNLNNEQKQQLIWNFVSKYENNGKLGNMI